MTNHWTDIKNADVVLIMGGNAAEAHPCGFKWVIEAKQQGAKLVVVDPRFTRSAAMADHYAPIRRAPTSPSCSARSTIAETTRSRRNTSGVIPTRRSS